MTPVAKLSSEEETLTGNQPDIAAIRAILQHWVRAPTTPQRVAWRSRIVLLSLDGAGSQQIASRLGISKATVALWMKRFTKNGPEALLHDAPGRGRHPSMTATAMRDRLRQANLLGPDDLPLSTRRAAAFLGVSATSVWRALHKSHSSHNSKPLADAS